MHIILIANGSFIFHLGSNLMVATDASCYMAWIAREYGLQLPREYKVKDSCFQPSGNRNDFNRGACM